MKTESNIEKYLNPKWLDTDEYQKKREVVRKETNKYPLIIDYACFKKTKEEKAKLFGEKEAWKEQHKKIKLTA